MTDDDRFESHLAATVRADAPEVAPAALRRRVEGSLRDAETRRSMPRIPLVAVAAGVVVLLVATAVGAPWLDRIVPGATSSIPAPTGMGTQTSPETTGGVATIPPVGDLVTDPGQVQTGQLLTTSDGWVLNTNARLFMTHSGGSTWKDVTPPGLSSDDPFVRAFFLDPMRGWLSAFDGQPNASLVIWRTTDSGQTWSRSALADVQPANWDLVFQTPIVGWLASDPGGQSPKPELRWTNDGGATWSDPINLQVATGIPTLPDLAFADRERGVLTAGDIIRTTGDGGQTWSSAIRVHLPALGSWPWVQTSPPPSAADSGSATISLGAPTFVDPEHGFIVMTVASEATTPTEYIYTTSTAGASWRLTFDDHLARQWSFLTASMWIGLSDGQVWTTHDGGMTFLVQASVGLPTPLDYAAMTFIDPQHGWGPAERGGCPPNHFGCFRAPDLFATFDGGQFWTRIGDCIDCDSPTPT